MRTRIRYPGESRLGHDRYSNRKKNHCREDQDEQHRWPDKLRGDRCRHRIVRMRMAMFD